MGAAVRNIVSVCAVCLIALSGAGSTRADEPVRFNRDVRPILADNCFNCHGPDSVSREADLRLDRESGLRGETGEGAPVIASGDPAASALYQRIIADDPSLRMPPSDSGKSLTPEQIDTLRRWIEQGAPWEEHWAFQLPVRTAPPGVSRPEWIRNEIDRFVLAELDRRGWQPSGPASLETLVRRVTLDLTGLPRTPNEVTAFLDDPAPERYERLVDRLLASPRYGEHMAVDWLDAARFADTSGYQTDGPREMWRWRDWVIAAYNANMPFDQFTIEQLAGDLLPDPTLNQLIATGFNRNHRANSEGGIIPEEYAVEYVVDRVDTTGSVWLGLTVGCVRCHEHKYDPIAHKEYYQLYAYFNNVPELGRAWKLGNSPPYIPAPTPDQAAELAALRAQRDAARQAWSDIAKRAAEDQQVWEQSAELASATEWTLTDGLDAWFPLDGGLGDETNDERVLESHTGATAEPAGTQPVATTDASPTFIESPAGAAVEFDGNSYLSAQGAGGFGFPDSFSVAAWVKPVDGATGGIVSRMVDTTDVAGWGLHLRDGHVQVNLVSRWLDDALRVETEAPLKPNEWQHVAMTYDGTRVASGVNVYINGEPAPLRVNLDALNQTFLKEEPLRIGTGNNQEHFTGAIADVRVYSQALSNREVSIISVAEPIPELAEFKSDQRAPAQATKLEEFFLTHSAALDIQSAYAAMRDAEEAYAKYERSLPNTMVMAERPQRQAAHVLMRGAYDKPGEVVTAGVPQALLGDRAQPGDSRLDLARWLVDPGNPLTARVAVNRIWQKLFGTGIVKTSEDFGTQGEPPSHPELLDWLATEFIRTGWNQKALLRLIVTSATYRQSSSATAEQIENDPENRWLARGPRFRMSAEMVRDQALAIAGLLQERLGGPSVKPYQPDGLWEEIASDTDYARSTGPDLYRRSLYAFVKRTVANPTLVVFDSSTREFCLLRRTRTNTPLQALTLMNDVTFVEAARVLAQHILADETDEDARLSLMMQRAAARPPHPAERTVLRNLLDGHRQHFRDHPEAAAELIRVGDAPSPADVDPVELAAHTLVASLVLNLDEVITKE